MYVRCPLDDQSNIKISYNNDSQYSNACSVSNHSSNLYSLYCAFCRVDFGESRCEVSTSMVVALTSTEMMEMLTLLRKTAKQKHEKMNPPRTARLAFC